MRLITVWIIAAGALAAQTAQQAETGRGLYQARCSTCHATDLGGGEGPQLAGANFVASWGTRTARELVNTIRTTMPPASPGSLDENSAVNLAAFILAANGAAPGNQALGADRASPSVLWPRAVPRLRCRPAARSPQRPPVRKG